MTRSSVTRDYRSAGFGGLSFVTNSNFANLPMSYEQRLWALESNYAFLLAKIEEDTKYKDNQEIKDLIRKVRAKLEQAGKDYDPNFENKTFGQPENKYRSLLCQIFEDITALQGKTKMIENVTEEQVHAG